MKQVNYILVNETAHKNSVCDVHHRFVPDIGQCIVVEAGSKFKVDLRSSQLMLGRLGTSTTLLSLNRSLQGSKERAALIDELIRLRRHYPKAKILGTSELDGKSIKVSKVMNGLRRELSDLP